MALAPGEDAGWGSWFSHFIGHQNHLAMIHTHWILSLVLLIQWPWAMA